MLLYRVALCAMSAVKPKLRLLFHIEPLAILITGYIKNAEHALLGWHALSRLVTAALFGGADLYIVVCSNTTTAFSLLCTLFFS